MVRIAINGFGRIGRLALRTAIDDSQVEIAAINDPGDLETMAHLLRFDSAHSRFPGSIDIADNALIVDGKHIPVFHQRDPLNLPWKDLAVDVVTECTGVFRTKEKASLHLQAGARKVLISAPAKEQGVKTIVKGVNEHTYNPDTDHVISNASCTTNCLAPIVKVLQDNFGVRRGFMVTVHAYTADQRIVDARHSDLRRARSAAFNIIPTTTGAATAVGEVIPEVKGKLDGMAMRVPVVDGSLLDLTVDVNKSTTKEEVDHLFEQVSIHHLKDILEFSRGQLVSSDIIGNPHSSIFDSAFTRVIDHDFLEIVAWYDNEWGYANRLIDVAKIVGSS